jgi:hypothetical protein
MSSLFELFGNDPASELDGEWFEIKGTVTVLLARAGGRNTAYEAMLNRLLRPRRQQLKSSDLPVQELRNIQAKCFARTVVKGWKTLIDGTWQTGLPSYEMREGRPVIKDGTMPCTPENVERLLLDLPDLHEVLIELASEGDNFREHVLEEELKN